MGRLTTTMALWHLFVRIPFGTVVAEEVAFRGVLPALFACSARPEWLPGALSSLLFGLGATYANLFPTKVRALAVDGVLDPIAWSTGRRGEGSRVPFSPRLRSAQGAWATLRQFFVLCDRGGDTCAFSGGDPRLRYDRLADRLRAEPALLPNGRGASID